MKRLLVIIFVLFLTVSLVAQSIVPVSSVDDPTKTDVKNLRSSLIESIARELRFRHPSDADSLVPEKVFDSVGIADILVDASKKNPALLQEPNFCDEGYTGQPIDFVQTAELTLNDLLFQIHNRFGINFVAGPAVVNQPINVKIDNVPWTTVLRSQLFILGIRSTCIGDGSTIQLVKNEQLPRLQDTAEVKTSFVKLNFLQPATTGNVDIAGRSNNRGTSQSNQCQGIGGGGGGQFGGGGGQFGGGGNQACGIFERLIIEIEKILGLRPTNISSVGGGGGQTGQQQQTEAIRTDRYVTQVPGRNILAIRATDEEMDLIDEIITRADRAPFQIVVRGLVYTANENKLKDIGVQTEIFTDPDKRASGGIFGVPVSGLGTLFDFSTMIGTTNFNVQASALAQNGVISIKSRPFAAVLDGETVDLDVGRQIPVLIQAQNTIGGVPGTLEILEAGNILSLTPQVLDDENGEPKAVSLTLQLESNDVDLSVVSQGVPSVNRRSIQTKLLLNEELTIILGGFTVDTISRDVSKTPGLGDIPLIGLLFKRRINRKELNRLYFAISVQVVKYGEIIPPASIPGADTVIPGPTKQVLKTAGEDKLSTEIDSQVNKSGTIRKNDDNDNR
ncbi:MAG TPA: type II and III secretion system protein [Aridibacter sp.]|nr:type II and III secretion system protein [Aridibacter sp.]